MTLIRKKSIKTYLTLDQKHCAEEDEKVDKLIEGINHSKLNTM